jgi:hypothetical protein
MAQHPRRQSSSKFMKFSNNKTCINLNTGYENKTIEPQILLKTIEAGTVTLFGLQIDNLITAAMATAATAATTTNTLKRHTIYYF